MNGSNRLLTWAAIVAAVLACCGIIAYFAIANRNSAPVIPTFVRPVVQPVPVAVYTPPAPSAPQPETPTPPVVTPPPAPPPPPAPVVKTEKKEPDVIAALIPPPRVTPEMFVFTPLPFDAVLAEFPLVLVGQKQREWYVTRDMELDRELSSADMDILARMRSDLFGISSNRPPPPPPPPNPESPSGL